MPDAYSSSGQASPQVWALDQPEPWERAGLPAIARGMRTPELPAQPSTATRGPAMQNTMAIHYCFEGKATLSFFTQHTCTRPDLLEAIAFVANEIVRATTPVTGLPSSADYLAWLGVRQAVRRNSGEPSNLQTADDSVLRVVLVSGWTALCKIRGIREGQSRGENAFGGPDPLD